MAELMRLQKYIALCGIASRRKAEELISGGAVFVNQVCVQTPGVKIDPSKDKVTVNGKPITIQEQSVYIMLNKPRGYVSTVSDNFGRKTVLDLIPQTLGRLYPVGRLDYDSEGLILLTNDGDFTYRLTHPSHEVTKTYRVTVNGKVSNSAFDRLRRGVMIDGRKTRPATIKQIVFKEPYTTFFITIHEGRNRQVRKMCDAVGYPVVALCRVAEGVLELGSLAKGAWRHLTPKEISQAGGHADVYNRKN